MVSSSWSREDYRQSAVSPGTRYGLHDNLYVAPKFGETVHQPPLRKTAELTSQQVGKLRLRHSQQLGGLGLGEALPLDDLRDLAHELGFDQHLVGIGVPENGVATRRCPNYCSADRVYVSVNLG